jgi:hypothetical protein
VLEKLESSGVRRRKRRWIKWAGRFERPPLVSFWLCGASTHQPIDRLFHLSLHHLLCLCVCQLPSPHTRSRCASTSYLPSVAFLLPQQPHHIMTDAMEKNHFSRTMPAPPPFWKSFTQANLERLREIRSKSEPVPPELEVLLPPPPPADGKYRSFGGTFDVRSALIYGWQV